MNLVGTLERLKVQIPGAFLIIEKNHTSLYKINTFICSDSKIYNTAITYSNYILIIYLIKAMFSLKINSA